MVHRIGKKIPQVEDSAFVAWNAEVAGDVTLAEDTSVWFGAALMGDIAPIRIGKGSNIQDNATCHVDYSLPLVVGERVTVGHNAVLHGCTVGDDCVIGMGAVVLSGAVIGKESIVGAGALVTEGTTFPPRSVILGTPAKVARQVDDAGVTKIRENGQAYVRLAREAVREYRRVDTDRDPS